MKAKSLVLLARRKHGQRAWNPHASSHGAAPSTGITASEALQIAYRPMPLPQTVEYEEDFGDNLIIHREFISKKNREAMDFQLSSLAYSETELRRGRQHLASIMNRERAGATIGIGGRNADRVAMHFSSDDNAEQSTGIRSAHYLFNEQRMHYCERFQRFFSDFERRNELSKIHGKAVGTHDSTALFSLMEACAILYGCETREAQETYLQMFLGLSTERLEQDESKVEEALGSLPLESGPPPDISSLSVSPPTLPLPSLFDDVDTSPSSSSFTIPPIEEDQNSPCDAPPTPHVKTRNNLKSYDISTLARRTHVRERRRWRSLIEKLVDERYDELTSQDYGDAVILNHQLHTVKFFDLKIGDVIQQMMTRLQQDQNSQNTSLHSSSRIGSTPQNPEQNNQ